MKSFKNLRRFGIALATFCFPLAAFASDLGHKEGQMWWPYLEWTLQNSHYEGDPFDVVATVTFSHESGCETRTTEMFYDGENVWKLRFTGTRVGEWRFETSSENRELNGHKGSVTVKPNPDANASGFLTHVGNKFALQMGNDGHLEGYLFNVYMDGVKFLSRELADWDDARTTAYCEAAKENGFEVLFFHMNNNWFQLGALPWDQHHSSQPDLETFRLLERILAISRTNGCRLHFWAWGDESRKWTPIGVGGINGPADRRLQRYIAARLGPLPGWSMGYGFDLHEWTRPEQLNSWSEYLHQHLGWQHLLCSRGEPLKGRENIYSYDGFGRDVTIATTPHGPRNFEEIVADMEGNTLQPHLYEERHSYRRDGFALEMEGTRRLLWWEAMAGGMGGFFGFYNRNSNANLGYPYPNPEQLRTHYTFWHMNKRFLLNFEKDRGLDFETIVLRDESGRNWAVYKEDARSIQINLSGAPGSLPAVAVDTTKEYREVDLGLLEPGSQTIDLPHNSDWAIAIGEFGASGKR